MRPRAKPTQARTDARSSRSSKASKQQGARIRDLEKRLAEAVKREAKALDQHTATSAILRMISASPTDPRPVFDAIVRSAVRLCDARFANVFRLEGEVVHLVAHHNLPLEALDQFRRTFPQPLSHGGTITAQAMLRRTVIHVHDIELLADIPVAVRALSSSAGYRSALAVPILRNGSALGAIGVGRSDGSGAPRPFSDTEIDLLTSFADQAVIAIENVRLFKELDEKNHALTQAHARVTEALEQQTATSEILRVIASSPTDVQPIFETIAESAARLCEAFDVSIFRVDGDRLAFVAHHGPIAQRHGDFSLPLVYGTVGGRSVLESRTVQIADLQNEDLEFPDAVENARRFGFRTILSVPLLREDIAIGGIQLRRTEVQLFSERQVALLQTFADQAVIAIENVRLFTELQQKNSALIQAHTQVSEALEQQTATSEILRAISSLPTDLEPVFEAIARSAGSLCGGVMGGVFRYDGELMHLGAMVDFGPGGEDAWRQTYPRPATRDTASGRAILDCAVVMIPDVHVDTRAPWAREVARTGGYRSSMAAPMVRDGAPIGVILVCREEPGSFPDSHIQLLRTFAEQAVIAIENVRLFKELEARTHDLTRSVGELRALGEVGQAISSTLDLQTVLSTIVARATELSGTDAGVIYEYNQQREIFVPRATEHLEAEIVETMLATPVQKGEGATGRLAEVQEPIQVPDILAAPAESRVRNALVRAGYRALLAVPLVREEHLIGGLTVIRKATGAFAPEVVDLLRTFATQSALAIQNARLFLEVEDKSRQLEVVSQHKSEFLANMSHELRTPLNAVIGFSEVLGERMFGELNDKQAEYVQDINASGTHLLSLINDILDLSKIEAGRMELELADFHMPQAIDNALVLVRERALRRGITLEQSVDPSLGDIHGDERKVKQVLLNLLSNAIKFTPEGGRVGVRAALVDERVEVAVSDTGVGIALEHHEAVFEEFRQVGAAEKRGEGTGLGLALARKFIELHGGRIWVQSEVGVGSTFTFTLPMRHVD